jgi:TolA-binding protein
MNTSHIVARLAKRTTAGCLAAALVVVVGTAVGADTPPPTDSFAELGMSLEAARRLPSAERDAAFATLDQRLGALLDGDVDDTRKAAVMFLAGEIRFAAGRYNEAAQSFRAAEKEAKNGPLADDAGLAAIQSLEAAARNADVEKEWNKWFRTYARSSAASDAMIARAWSAIRGDSLGFASKILTEAKTRFPWVERDPRVTLATSTVAYFEGRYAEVTVQPSGSPLDAACVYLRALTEEANKRPLQAAAKYQEVVDRYDDPRLRDIAMLSKANVFLKSGSYKSAAEEFEVVINRAQDPKIVAEAQVRSATAVYLAGDTELGTQKLRSVAASYEGGVVAARAQAVLGEVLFQAKRYEESIIEFNQVLTRYFQHGLASLAQYRIGRSLDALDRHAEAAGAYQAVVAGYPTSREAPAAAYLAGAGLLAQNKPQAAIPYFRLVLDRYARDTGEGTIEFATPERQELVEASLCLLELSYHRTGNLGLLSGVPHLMLQRMPASKSPWRANAILIDADALAAQGRHTEAQTMLQQVIADFATNPVAVPAYRLLAWSYAQEGKLDLAMEAQDRMLARYGSASGAYDVSSALLNRAHILFNEKKYKEAAHGYEEFLAEYPQHPDRVQALYQAGMCYQRLNQNGDAVDRWSTLTTIDSTSALAEKAWSRAGDVYFTTGHYAEAQQCYQGLVKHFGESKGVAIGWLRIAQCHYNTSDYAGAVEAYSQVITRYPDHAVATDAKRGIEQALYQLGQRKDGEATLAELVERFPSSSFAADAQFEIALRRYQAEDWEAAADAFRRVVSQFPSYSAGDRAYYLMADALSRAGKADEARTAFEQFVAFFPRSQYKATVQLQLGAARFAAGDYMRAAVDFTAVLEDSVTREVASAARYNLALCHRMLGDPDKARAMLEAYRKENPNDERAAEVAHQLGALEEDAGRYAEAAKEYERALAAKIDAALAVELNYRVGLCREKLGEEKAALAAYTRATAHKEKDNAYRLSALARSAALYESRKDYPKALAAYRDLIKNATDPEIVVAARERASELQSAGAKQ